MYPACGVHPRTTGMQPRTFCSTPTGSFARMGRLSFTHTSASSPTRTLIRRVGVAPPHNCMRQCRGRWCDHGALEEQARETPRPGPDGACSYQAWHQEARAQAERRDWKVHSVSRGLQLGRQAGPWRPMVIVHSNKRPGGHGRPAHTLKPRCKPCSKRVRG